jgi:hypothetical protein
MGCPLLFICPKREELYWVGKFDMFYIPEF